MKVLLSQLLFLISSSFIFGQNDISQIYIKANLANKHGQKETAIELYKKAIHLAEKEKKIHLAGDIGASLATLFYEIGDYKSASDICETRILQLTKNNVRKDTVWFKLYVAMAPSFKNQYLPQKAINGYFQAKKILEQVPIIESQIPLHVGYHYFNEGVFWLKINDINRAKVNIERALEIGLKINHKELLVDVLMNLGSIYAYESSTEKGIEQLNKAFSLIKDDPNTKPLDLARGRLILASLHNKSGREVKASSLLDAIIADEKRLKTSTDGKNVFVQAVFEKVQISSSLKYLEKIGDITLLPVHLQAEYFIAIAKHEANLMNWVLSIAAYEKALEKLELKYDKKWRSKDLLKSFNVLANLADVSYQEYLRYMNNDYFDLAFKYSKNCIELADEIRKEHTSFESKLFFSEKNYEQYKKAIRLKYQLYEQKKEKKGLLELFSISENAKSYMMSLSQIRNDFQRNQKEDSLALKLSAYKSYIAYLKSKNTPKDVVVDFEQKADLVLNELSLSTKSREYIGKNALGKLPQLPNDQLYVNYIIQDSYLLILCLGKEGIVTKKVPLNLSEFQYHKEKLKGAFSRSPSPYEGFRQSKSCKYFYRILIESLPVDRNHYSRLAINPDNELFDFSFDVLQNPNSGKYLIQEFAISYVVSVGDLISESLLPEVSKKCNVFLPFASKNNGMYQKLQPLKFSLQRSKGINGDFYLDQDASKSTFMEKLKDSRSITMISTHAEAGENEPYLFFDEKDSVNSRLYASELPYFRVNSPLIILNACESNTGKKVNGMGLLSLSESFRIAGGKSVLGSMWQADEESTAVISSLFYRYIMKGYPKDIALQHAKLDFFETEVGKRNDLPFYWAHLQLIGESSAVKTNKTYTYLLGVLALGIVLFFIRKLILKRVEI